MRLRVFLILILSLAAIAIGGCDRTESRPAPAASPAATVAQATPRPPRTLDDRSIAELARDVESAKAQLRFIALFSPT